MNLLLLADLHLSAVAREEYRWRLFPWLLDTCPKHKVATVIILGDLTEAKDYHSARLVNRIVDELCKLKQQAGTEFIILPGNHDGIDPGCPYFRFLGQFPFIHYYQTPFLRPLSGDRLALFLPHTKEPEKWDVKLLQDANLIFMHQTVSGAVSETGVALEGHDLSAVLRVAHRAKIWSGDIHVPQKCGSVEYVGAPYPVRFGDSFTPRAVLLKGARESVDLATPHFGKLTITIERQEQVRDGYIQGLTQPGDQVKVRVRLTRAEFVAWEKVKRDIIAACTDAGVELCGLEVERVEESAPKVVKRRGTSPVAASPEQTLVAWSERQKLDAPLVEAGKKILASVVK